MADGKVHFHVVCVAKSRAFVVQRLRLFVVAGAAPGRRRTRNKLFLVEAANKSQFSVYKRAVLEQFGAEFAHMSRTLCSIVRPK